MIPFTLNILAYSAYDNTFAVEYIPSPANTACTPMVRRILIDPINDTPNTALIIFQQNSPQYQWEQQEHVATEEQMSTWGSLVNTSITVTEIPVQFTSNIVTGVVQVTSYETTNNSIITIPGEEEFNAEYSSNTSNT